ncbi:unnamed protein product [Prorocentrum cordatum]|uniref:Uncharacterized protein n=1 Tax=Prorocentrum cordatum TaxID=2364126 RepID=A0ABN9U828_9DINO|nr:unnamed protein product [Polarella glacialis]
MSTGMALMNLAPPELRRWSGDCPCSLATSALAPLCASSRTMSSLQPRRTAAQSGHSTRGSMSGRLAASGSAPRAERTCARQFRSRPESSGSECARLTGGGTEGTLRQARGVLGGVSQAVCQALGGVIAPRLEKRTYAVEAS